MTTQRTIEVCGNNEWLSLGGDRYQNEAGHDWRAKVSRKLDDLFGHGTAIMPHGERRTWHGWNGANTFARKHSGIATFDEFSDKEWASAVAIASEAYNATDDDYEKLGIDDDLASLREAVELEDESTIVEAWQRMTDYNGFSELDEPLAELAADVARIAGGELLDNGTIEF